MYKINQEDQRKIKRLRADTVVPTLDYSKDASSDNNEELIIESPANKSIGDGNYKSAIRRHHGERTS